MTLEQAYTHKLLLQAGIYDIYDNWIKKQLEIEDPLTDIILMLSTCGSNINNTISILHNYTIKKPINKSIVFDSIRLILKDKYLSGELSKEECLDAMYIIGAAEGNDIKEPWQALCYLRDYYDLALSGVMRMDSFNHMFDDFIFSKKLLNVTSTKKPKPLNWLRKLLKGHTR